jgi:8-oxo-dGTP pyrophosphatase MutT (NUDIX family)
MTGPQPARPAHFTFVAAVHLFLVRDGAVLLLRRQNTGYEDGRYSVIAGHLDGDETVYTAMIREAREEASITIAPADLAVVGVMQRRATAPGDDERIDIFLAPTAWSGTIVNAEPHKCDELSWYPLDHLPDNVVPYVRRALANYRAGVWFDTLGWPGI